MKLLMTPLGGPTEMTAFCSAPLVPLAIGAAGSAVSDMFSGDDDEGGGGGGGKPGPAPYQLDKSAYQDPRAGARDDELTRLQYESMNRSAAQGSAAQRTQLAQALGGQIAPTERSANVQLGPAAQGSAVTGTATTGDAANINREDRQFRGEQVDLINRLKEQADGRGPSLAEGQLRAATDRNIKQQLAVGATQRGNPALAQRNVSLAAAQMGAQASRDAAQMRIQEQQNARAMLGNVIAGARSQDIGVNTSQAGFNQEMNRANMDARNQFGMANMNAQNQFGMANMDARNRFALQQGQMDLENNQFNAAQGNTRSLRQADLDQQTNLFNADAANDMYGQNLSADQAMRLANLNADMQQRQLNDQTTQRYLGMKLDSRENDRNAGIRYEESMKGGDLNDRTLQERANQRNMDNENKDDDRLENYINHSWSNANETVKVAKMPSDPRAKNDVRSLSAARSLKTSDENSKATIQRLSSQIAAMTGQAPQVNAPGNPPTQSQRAAVALEGGAPAKSNAAPAANQGFPLQARPPKGPGFGGGGDPFTARASAMNAQSQPFTIAAPFSSAPPPNPAGATAQRLQSNALGLTPMIAPPSTPESFFSDEDAKTDVESLNQRHALARALKGGKR